MPADSLALRVERFIRRAATLDAAEAESELLPLLTDVLDTQDIKLTQRIRPEPQATDFVGVSGGGRVAGGRVGVEYKHYGDDRPVRDVAIDQVVRLGHAASLDRVLLISRSGFSTEARELASRDHPFAIELLTLEDLSRLAESADAATPSSASRIVALLRGVAEEAARIVAADPSELDHLEWRDLERMVAAVLDGLGFAAELTPGSKDGGKDVIVKIRTDEGVATYIVELKHWRSGKRVGDASIRDFVKVVAREQRNGGLFLSTHGYTEGAFEALTEVERRRVRFGGADKVVSLCRSYVRLNAGLWRPDADGLSELLFSNTTDG